MADEKKSGGRSAFADAFEEAAEKLLDEPMGEQAPTRPSVGPDVPFTGEETDRIDMAMGLKSIGSNAPVSPTTVPTRPTDDPGNQGTDVVDPVKPSQPPSDQIEAPDRPAEAEPPSVRFPDNDQPDAPAEGSDDLGLPPSQQPDLEHEGTGAIDSTGFGELDEGDLMPAEVQDQTFPDPSGVEFDDPGFSLEPSGDFGAESEVPSDSIDGFDAGGSADEGF